MASHDHPDNAPWDALDDGLSPAEPRPRRPWRAKFRDALRGLKVGIRGHSSFFVHFFIAAIVLAAAAVLQCSLIEWSVLTLCIGFVLTAELMNSAIESLFAGLDVATRERSWHALDIAAGAVLLASFIAALIGVGIFVARIGKFLHWWGDVEM